VNAWKIICATLVIFVAGIITGASLMKFAQSGKPFRPRQNVIPGNDQKFGGNRPDEPMRPRNSSNNPDVPNQPGPQTGILGRQFVLGLERQFQLTSDQREKVEKILAEGQERIRLIRSKSEPEIRKEMQNVHEQIKSLLAPEQREQFERMTRQRFNQRSEPTNAPERRFREPRNPGGFRGQQPPPDAPPADEPAPPNP